jgi:hypothetical protein
MWEREACLPEHISNAWAARGSKNNLDQVQSGLAGVMEHLHKWSKEKFGSVRMQLEKPRTRLEELLNMNADRKEIREVTDHMNELLYREEMMWMQRSRIDWLREGDRNTKKFHSKTVWRARKNKVKHLEDDTGELHTEPEKMGSLVNDYFEALFSSDPTLDQELVLSLIQPKVTEEMNDKLLLDFTDREIADALFQIGPLKAPGPDGFPARFFQRNWGLLKDENVLAVKEFFRTGVMLDGVNDATILLIPKVDQPKKVTHFRPISLCNVIYKVLAKCLVNRMRPILDDLISPNQSAFVPGRLITDNALVAFECFHYIQQEKDPEKSMCAYKLDLSKAYDRVDCTFLEQAMQKIGFDHRWVKWIMTCVTTVKYQVKFNGAILDSFAPSRGLRQGDPLSPFLFLFVADGLSALLRKEVLANQIEPVKVCRRAPGVSHLLFADDTLLFFKASQQQAQHISDVIDTYATATGQLINRDKCSILFGPNCPEATGTLVKQILQVRPDVFEDKYLGLPTPQGRMHKGRFQNLQERLLKRMLAWDGLHSQAAKETLIKSVAQSIPTYIMGIFKLPMAVCDDLTRMVRNYWWGAIRGNGKLIGSHGTELLCQNLMVALASETFGSLTKPS